MTQMELNVLLWIQEHLRAGWLDGALKFLSTLNDGGVIWIAFFLVLVLIPRTRRAGIMVGAALLLMLVIGNLGIKNVVARPRPCHINEAIELLVERPSSYSFPSGHTASSFAVVFALLFGGSRLWKWTLPVAMLIAFSRLYLFVHFPTDILGGVALGLLCGWLGALIVRLAMEKAEKNRIEA